MKKIIISVLLVLLVGVSTIMGTYAVIINVVSDNGVDKIVDVINIKDLLSDDNGNYNSTYYDVRDELNISDSEMDVLMNSSYLNDSLKIVLDNVVSYKLRGGTKLSNDDIYINKEEDFYVLSKIVLKITLPASIIANFSQAEIQPAMLLLCLVGFAGGVFY